MFNILKRKKEPGGDSFFEKLKKGLSKTRSNFTEGLANLILGKKELDFSVFEAIETQLLLADVGVEVTQELIENLTQQLNRKELDNTTAALQSLSDAMIKILQPCEVPIPFTKENKPFVILVVGINGSGKTTTIGKLAYQFKEDHKKVLLAAGDTFRAAAIEQLQRWGEKNKIDVIAQRAGADTASVIYDALEAAKARNIDILLADTAGRLHTQTHLMNELEKVKRVLKKIDPTAPHEILLILDASIGQNALIQATQFHKTLEITGLVLTKLDGTAKGGIVFAIAKKLGLPIRYIGVGEGIEDLRLFNAADFVGAIFSSL